MKAWVCNGDHPGVDLPISVPKDEACSDCGAREPVAARIPFSAPSEPPKYQYTVADRVVCASCGEWIYPRRPIDKGGLFLLPPSCDVCRAPV